MRTGERARYNTSALIASDRCSCAPAGYTGANQDSCYSGKRHRHGVNLQGLVGLDGRVLYLGEAR